MVKFCALRPRFTVTEAGCAIEAVNSNPSKQEAKWRGPIVESVRFRFLIAEFIDDSLP
jgi:hypothetical protein